MNRTIPTMFTKSHYIVLIKYHSPVNEMYGFPFSITNLLTIVLKRSLLWLTLNSHLFCHFFAKFRNFSHYTDDLEDRFSISISTILLKLLFWLQITNSTLLSFFPHIILLNSALLSLFTYLYWLLLFSLPFLNSLFTLSC